MTTLPTVEVPCVLCGSARAEPVWTTPDRAFALPGLYTVARCCDCGFLYQRPRVHNEFLAACYPDNYPRHQEPSPRVPFKGSPARIRAVRWALASRFGYTGFHDGDVAILSRLWARALRRRLRWNCLPWIGDGRYLDAGGLGAALFGRAWCGLELPRHLSHFTPHTLERTVQNAGGRVVWCWHQAKPRYYLWSLSTFLRDRGASRLAALAERRPAYGALKLVLELALPLVSRVGRGEVIRIGAVHA